MSSKIPTTILITLAICFLYGIYLSCICQMFIWHDAIGYQDLGETLYHGGWIEYLKSGPTREPLYPFIISISMRLADYLSTSFKSVQIFIQILIMFSTQILTYMVLRKLKINTFLSALVLLYQGFSPALTISSIRLYSEIAVYPSILLIILASSRCWQNIHTESISHKRVALHSIFLGIAFLLAMFTKGIFELIVPLFLIPYVLIAINALIKHNRSYLTKTLIFLFTFCLTFYIPVTLYKQANKQLNGNYTFTNRGPWALYGNTARRMEPLTTKHFLMALAYVPRPEGCYALFGEKDCRFWHYTTSDAFGVRKRGELQRQKLTPREVDKQLILGSMNLMLRNPFQTTLFMGIESAKMLFWECSSMAYAIYPNWMIKLFYYKPFYLSLTGLIAVLTLIALCHLLAVVYQRRRSLFNEPTSILLAILTLVTAYISIDSFFLIQPRHSFPLVALYLISMAFFAQQTLLKPKRKTQDES